MMPKERQDVESSEAREMSMTQEETRGLPGVGEEVMERSQRKERLRLNMRMRTKGLRRLCNCFTYPWKNALNMQMKMTVMTAVI